MKVSLVVPDFLSGTSFLQQPLDFLYLTSFLRQKGHSVSVIDCRVHHLSIENTVKRVDGSDFIVVTTSPIDQVQNYFTDYRYAYSIRTINTIKNRLPESVLIVCGAHSTVRPDLVVKDIGADIFVKGEVWNPVPAIIENYQNKSKLAAIPNLVLVNNKDSVIYHTIEDNSLQHPAIPDNILPAYDAIEMNMYYGASYYDNVPIIKRNRCVVSGGRGCPFSCSFCHNFFGKTVHRRSPKTIAKELLILQNDYGIQEIFFWTRFLR